MRIGIFTDTYPPYINGVSTSIVMLKNGLEKLGHEVYVVTINNEKMSYKYEEEEKIIRIPGIPTGIYDYRLSSIYPVRILKKIKNWNLDVIHSHTEFGVGTFARIVAKQYHIPLVHTYHTMYEDYTHYITHGYFEGASKKIVEYLTKFYCDKTATELIVPTKKAYDLFKEKYRVNRNVHIVPTGIEVERFYKKNYKKAEISELRKKLGIKEKEFVILFIGRIADEKNIDFLIKNQKNIKNSNTRLVIVGDGPDLEKYKKMSEDLEIKNIIFTGKVPWDQVPIYYSMAQVFVTASKSETQGLTVIEALASSTPVLCIDDDSFRNVVINDLNGYLFKTDKEYIKYIELLMNDKELYKNLCKQAVISTEPYSSKYFALKVLDVYKTAIETNKKKGILNSIKRVVRGEKDE